MPDFAYTARDASGRQVAGTLSVGTEREAIAALAAQALFPVKVSPVGPKAPEKGSLRVPAQAASQFYVQLASLLRSGVPLLRGLEVLGQQTSNAALGQVCSDLRERVSEGESLSAAMARHPKAFGELATSIVKAGSEGGFLEEALERVAKFTDQQSELKSRVMGALAYPIFLAVFSVIIVTVLVVFFVPKFEALFARLEARGELPSLTTTLLWVSDTLSQYGLWIAIGLVMVGAVVRNRLATDEGRWQLDRWRLRLPQAGAIYKNFAVARFCRVLGTLLKGGVPIVRALQISSESTGNKVLAKAVNDASENITSGEPLATPLAASGHFPGDVVEMIAVAEQSNTLETVLTEIADSLEKQTWRRLDLFVRLLEPLMLLVMASAVMLIVIALLMPILMSANAM
ncbi:MAG: type II secretion system F family protein [Planctomycetota bacterium]